MIWFEWKKIFERRLNQCAMLAGYILLGVCVFSYISQVRIYDSETKSYIEGLEAVRLSQERAEGQTDVISEEYITKLVGDIQRIGVDFGTDEAYEKIARPLGDIYNFVVKNYTDMRESILDEKALDAIDPDDGAHFYEQRMKKITDYLNLDFSFGSYQENEKEYWTQKAEDTVIPFKWGDKNVMNILWSVIMLGFYLVFVVMICVSPVFSSEYESGAASLLLTTKYGKDRLVWAKIAASVSFSVLYLSIGILLAVIIIGLLLGFQGADLPVQLWNSVIPYNLTAGQACVWSAAVILLISIVITLFLLMCSARLHSSFAALVIGMAVMIVPVFLPMSKKSGLWNHINYLFPVRAMNVKEMLGAFVSYAAGDCVIPYMGMVVIVYLVIGAVSTLLIRKGFADAHSNSNHSGRHWKPASQNRPSLLNQ